MPRHTWMRLALLLLLVAVLAVLFAAFTTRERWETGVASSPPPTAASEPERMSFQELFADDLKAGWQVERSLHLPGPYRNRGGMLYWSDDEVTGTVRMRDEQHQIVWEYVVPRGQMAHHIWAETVDGHTAHGLLVRKN